MPTVRRSVTHSVGLLQESADRPQSATPESCPLKLPNRVYKPNQTKIWHVKVKVVDVERLIAAAAEVRLRAYAPYSRFLVGAAMELHDFPGIFVGCNVENASYGLTICAERMALGAAVAATDLQIHTPKRIVVVATPLATPCGACRQCLAEFGLDWEALCVDASDLQMQKKFEIRDLLPSNFRLD